MTQPRYIDPNSGAAPQPGGMVVGGAESQRGDAEEQLRAVQEAALQEAPTSEHEAELQRQIKVAQEQEAAKQGTDESQPPAKAETPDLAQSTAGTPAGEATPSVENEKGSGEVSDSMTKDELVEVAKAEGVEGYSTMNKPDLIEAINANRK